MHWLNIMICVDIISMKHRQLRCVTWVSDVISDVDRMTRLLIGLCHVRFTQTYSENLYREFQSQLAQGITCICKQFITTRGVIVVVILLTEHRF